MSCSRKATNIRNQYSRFPCYAAPAPKEELVRVMLGWDGDVCDVNGKLWFVDLPSFEIAKFVYIEYYSESKLFNGCPHV
jgi:hypothetical protein